jgi:hypothetical protein
MSMHTITRALARGRVVVGLAGVAIGLPAGLGLSQAHTAAAGLPGRWAAALDSAITWRATLTPPEAPAAGTPAVGGTATIKSADKKTRADVHLANAKPGSVHPWHVHKGTCGNDQGILGPPKDYKPIHVGGNGEGEVAQTLPFPTPKSGEYMVNVHESAADLKTIVACGNLQRE